MHANGAPPAAVERTLGDDEIIVTKTDLGGRITYVNDVFLRVSAYTEAEMLGQPHNKIRHPDMPRCIFKLLWDTITDRQEAFAYVMNLAGDGAHYWVLAHVTPSVGSDGLVVGYHSSRRVPTRIALDEIRPLYASLRLTEAHHQQPAEAIQASTAQLNEFLAERGMTYSEYLWSLAGQAATP